MRIDEVIKSHAINSPERFAVGFMDHKVTYKALDKMIDNCTNFLLNKNLKPKQKVGIMMLNTLEFIIWYYAVSRANGISVLINPLLTHRESEYILTDSSPKFIVSREPFIKNISDCIKKYSTIIDIDEQLNKITSFKPSLQPTQYEKTDVEDCTIIYSSGTTGRPKGIILTHNNLYSNAKVFSESIGLTHLDKTLIVSPLFHSAALTCCLNSTLLIGGYVHLLERWKSSEQTLTVLEKEEITFFFGPPTMYTYLLMDPKLTQYNLCLQIAFTGAAPLPMEVFDKWREIFNFEITEGYGLTETSPMVTLNPLKRKKRKAA